MNKDVNSMVEEDDPGKAVAEDLQSLEAELAKQRDNLGQGKAAGHGS